MLVVQLMTI